MPDSFDAASTLERVSDDEHRLAIPDGWHQGRGTFGGLILGILYRAMADREADATRLCRTVMGQLCGPAQPRLSRVVSRVLRRGNNQTDLSATLEQDGAILAQASCVLAASRRIKPTVALKLEAPPRLDPATVPISPLRLPLAPEFAQHYEYRPTGPTMGSGSDEALVHGFIKERVPPKQLTPASMLGRLDAYWPAIYSIEKEIRPAATVSFMAEILRDPATLDPAVPLFYRARAVALSGGYFVELRELWHDGEPVALNQQVFALLA
jgi:hypothetical protein